MEFIIIIIIQLSVRYAGEQGGLVIDLMTESFQAFPLMGGIDQSEVD